MKPTRRAQPYRGGGTPGHAHSNMHRGGPAHLPNPQDMVRATQRRARRRRRARVLYQR